MPLEGIWDELRYTDRMRLKLKLIVLEIQFVPRIKHVPTQL
jgi:hypothetical protein